MTAQTVFLIVLFHLSVFVVDVAAEYRPNILILLTDDQGYGDVGRHGHPFLKTPNMDRLHDESVRLTDFSVSPTCSPTRAALMTGMQELNSGVSHTLLPRRLMSREVETLPQLLSGAGYATALFGKWHLGQEDGYRPDERGFDSGLTIPEDNQRTHYDPELLLNGKPVSSKGYRTDIFFNEAMKWMEGLGSKGEPFFCYLATYNAHSPLVVPEKFAAPYRKHVDDKTANYFGMLANLDWNIGRMLAHIESLRLDDKTLIIFLNDNGGTFGVDTYNAGMRGCKGTIWRGGTRAFCFWRLPRKLKPRDENILSGHIDILPTLAEITGVELPEDFSQGIEGISLFQRLADPEATLPDRMIFQHSTRWGDGLADDHRYVNCSIRWQKWHLLRSGSCELGCNGECRIFRNAAAGEQMLYTKYPDDNYTQTPREKWSLFNLSTDPGEDHNVADELPDVVQQMAEAYETWWEKVSPSLINE